MNAPNLKRSPVIELNQQKDRFGRELRRLINVLLNCMFALTPNGTRRRRNILIIALLSIVFLFGFFSHSVSEWARHVRNILFYLLNPTVAAAFVSNLIQDFLQLILNTYLNSGVGHYLLLLVFPFLIAWLLAGIYLADIFEMPHVRTALSFIMQVALSGGSGTIRVREGELTSESEESPVYLIGGPGSVVVELDSAALFERPDGQPHIIGPTVDGPVILDGFERFRQAIDLRDQRTEPLNITSRSLDGIPVQAVDVNFLFSVVRDDNTQRPSAEHPYPFLNDNVIESLIYNQAARVTPDGPRPADIKKSWADAMTSLIRSALGSFMSEHDLTEYLARYGMPEIQSAREQENSVRQSAQRVFPSEGPLPAPSISDIPPAFIPRPDIKARLFGEFAQGFPIFAAQRGVELHWVGIGSWKTSSKIIPEQHLEAWQLSIDNQIRRNSGTPNLRTQHIIRFIQDVPLTKFADCLKLQRSHRETMINMLIGYREQYMQILHITEKKQQKINSRITNRIFRALQHINKILGWSETFKAHWVTGTPFENDDETESPRSAESTYQELVQLVGGDQATADRLIEGERARFPNASRQDLIEQAIERLLRDRQ